MPKSLFLADIPIYIKESFRSQYFTNVSTFSDNGTYEIQDYVDLSTELPNFDNLENLHLVYRSPSTKQNYLLIYYRDSAGELKIVIYDLINKTIKAITNCDVDSLADPPEDKAPGLANA